jgi:hypothetical protein
MLPPIQLETGILILLSESATPVPAWGRKGRVDVGLAGLMLCSDVLSIQV